MFFFYRGNDFRPEYLKCAELRSSFGSTPILGLSATINSKVLNDIENILQWVQEEYKLVSALPDRRNIYLAIDHSHSYEMEEKLSWVVSGLGEQQEQFPKTLIFANTVSAVSEIYEYMRCELGKRAYWRMDTSTVDNRLISMFHAQIGEDLKQFTVDYFKSKHSKLRVLISTIAFGLGMDIPDITQIIHWGQIKSVLSYWQQVGRAGRGGQKTKAIWYPKSTAGENKELLDKLKHDTSICIRKAILETFVLRGMDLSILKDMEKRTTCNKNCKLCECSLCLCCSHCRIRCQCAGQI